MLEAKKCISNLSFQFIEPQNLLFFKISSAVI